VWRAALLNSDAHSFDRKAIIDTVRARRAYLEDMDLAYQEARYVVRYQAEEARIRELTAAALLWKEQGKAVLTTLAETEADWFSMAAEGVRALSPMAGNAEYLRADGSLDLEKRLAEIQAANPSLRDLDPEDARRSADRLYRHSRLLLIGTIPLSLSLLGFTLAHVLDRRARYFSFALGVSVFLVTAGGLALVELTGLFV